MAMRWIIKLFMRERRVSNKIRIKQGRMPGRMKVLGTPRIQEPILVFSRRIIVRVALFGGSGWPSGPSTEDMFALEGSDKVIDSWLSVDVSRRMRASSPRPSSKLLELKGPSVGGRRGRGLGRKS
jgi:hypothetical protein